MEYKQREYNILKDEKSKLYYRQGTYDKEIIKEIKPTYSWMPVKDKVVLDIGGCFGAYSAMALKEGAKKVYVYEPLEVNYNLLKKNVANYDNCFPYMKALVPDNSKSVDFYVSRTQINLGNSSQYIKRGRMKLEVEAVNFKKELDRIRPSVVKVDCEGAEYNLFSQLKKIPDYIKYITIEFHLGKKEWREIDAPKLAEKFKNWECVKEPKLTGKNWNTIGKWKR